MNHTALIFIPTIKNLSLDRYFRNYDIIEIYLRNLHLNIIKNPLNGSSNSKIFKMNYQDLIILVGQYMTYEEFAKHNSELNIDRNEWYRLLDGNTYRSNKARLKERYLQDFDDDWNNQVNLAISIIKDEEETSN